MTAALRRALLPLALGLLAVGLSLPTTPPDSMGFQTDNTVLGVLAAVCAVRVARAARGTTGRLAVDWRATTVSIALFAVACLVTGSGAEGAFGTAGLGDLLVVPVLVVPLVVLGRLAWHARGALVATLLVDGVVVALALAVVVDVVVLSAPGHGTPTAVTLGYAGYAVLAAGLAAGLGTATSRDLLVSSSAMVVAVTAVAASAGMLAAGADRPVLLWQALGDVACVVAYEALVVAARCSPRRTSPVDDELPRGRRIAVVGVVAAVLAMVALPVALVVAAVRGQQLTTWSALAVALVVVLLLVRTTTRIRAADHLVADLVRTEDDLRDLVEGSADGVVVVDDHLRFRFTSPAARTLLGLPPDDGPLDRRLLDVVLAADRPRVRSALVDGGPTTLHLRVAGHDEQPTELEVTQHQRAGHGRRVLHLRDVTVRLRRERELERMAYTDHLTRLPNRALLFQELATPAEERCLLVLDLDGFKAVNDTAGHEAGDQLLVEVARRLRTVVRDRDVVCRLGGDEFAVVVDGTLAEAVEAAQRVVDVMALPHRTADRTFALGASVGVAELAVGAGQLAFREADTALRAAKAAGKGCVRVWDGGAGADAAGSVTAAIAGGQVQLRYSVAGRDDEPRRALHGEPFWAHPSGALLPPAELWAAAGRQGCDVELQRWLLHEATREAAGIAGVGLLALDLVAGHVVADRLVEDVRSALAASGLAPGQLSLAFTEETLLTSAAELVPALHELRALGVRLCFDDFGMGQTLYAHLARVPLSSVRVDVSALGSQDPDHLRRTVQAIVSSADVFGLATVAHGVAPGPLLDAVLEAGVRMVRTREDLRHVTVERVREELASGLAGVRILAR